MGTLPNFEKIRSDLLDQRLGVSPIRFVFGRTRHLDEGIDREIVLQNHAQLAGIKSFLVRTKLSDLRLQLSENRTTLPIR